MKKLILPLLLCAVALADTNQLFVATVRQTRGTANPVFDYFVLSNVVSVAQCRDKPTTTCTNLLYLRDGKTNRFHTHGRFTFELRPQ